MSAIMLLPLTLVSLHVKIYRTFSPIDERQHVDYLYRISRGELLGMGEQIGQDALRDEACRGVDWPMFKPPCHPNEPYNPDIYPDLGYNSAHIHPPTYYFLTAIAIKTFDVVGIAENFVSAGRAAGGLWLALALVFFWHVGASLGIGVSARVIVMVLLVTTPAILHASSTVNPDASALFAGTLLLLATITFERVRGRTVLMLPVVAAVAVGLKATNLLAVGACAVYLFIRWRLQASTQQKGERRGPELLIGAGALIVGGVTVALAWMFIHGQLIRAPIDPQIDRFQVDSLSGTDVAGQFFALVTPISNPWLPSFFNNVAVTSIVRLLNLVLVVATFGAIVSTRSLGRSETIALSGAAILLVGGMGLTLSNYYLNSGIFVEIPARYGISLLPFLFVALAAMLRWGLTVFIGGVLAAAAVVTALSGLLSAL